MERSKYQKQWRRSNQLLGRLLNQDIDDNNSMAIEDNCINNDIAEDCNRFFQDDLWSENNSEESSSGDENSNDVYSGVDDNNDNVKLESKIGQWILRNKINRTAANELLAILKKHGHEELPNCCRTILRTPRQVVTIKKCGGDYVYLGLLNGIKRILSENQAAIPDKKINLIVNVDGVLLYKSSGAQFWPILCRFHKLPPFIVAIYYGNKKPSNVEDFVLDFFTEYRNLRNDGVEFGGVKLSIEFFSFVCDAPARQFLKAIKGHNGYWSCERCEIQGLYESSRIVFHTIDCTPRVNDIFNNYGYAGKHQVQRSCLIDYGINCINGFPLDYMHLVCLGVMKRLILF